VPRSGRHDIRIIDGQHRILGLHYAIEDIARELDENRNLQNAAARDGDIDLGAFDPDAPIQRPPRMGKTDIDLAAFNPDAPAGEVTLTPTEAPLTETFAPPDAASLKADAPPADSSSSPVSIDAWLATPAPSAPAVNAPSVGFKPLDPFAPAPVATETPPIDAPITMTPPSPATPPTAPAKREKATDILNEALEDTKDLGTEPVEAVPEDEQMLDRLITGERIEQLWARIDAAEKAAVDDDKSLPKQRALNLENIRTARNLLLGGRKNYENALRYVAEVESDVRYAERVRHWSVTWGTGILLYNVLWLALLALGYAMSNRVIVPFVDTGLVDSAFGVTMWVTILTGGLGGVVKSLFSLVAHVSKQDFDTQHLHWYWTSPLIGAVLGIFVIFFSNLALTSLGTGVGTSLNTTLVVYTLSWIIGFQQNLVLELIERTKKMIFPDKKDESKGPIASIPKDANAK